MNGFNLTRSKALLSLFLLAVAADLFSTACSIRKPEAPSWMTDWEIPLVNRTFTVSDLLDDMSGDNIVLDDSANPFIQFSQGFDTISLDQSLMVEGGHLDLKDSVGLVEIESPQPVNTFFNLNDIIPISMGFVPPAPFEITRPLQKIDNFSWAHIEQGVLSVTFHNALEVDLDTFSVTLIDLADMHELGTLNYYNGLTYLETETQQLDISGQTISNTISMRCHGHTPGGLLINAGAQRLESDITFPAKIIVSAASSRVEEINHSRTGSYEINDSTKVYTSVIYQGNLNARATNYTDLPYNVTLHSHNLKMQGSDFTLNRRIEAHNFIEIPIDLAGYSFIPDGSSGMQNVLIDMINIIPSSGEDEYTFRASDSLTVHVDISQIFMESLTGRIKPQPITIDTATQTLDLPDGLDRAHLTHANLSLVLDNNCMVPAYTNITIDGDGRMLHLSGLVAGKSSPDAPPAVTTLTANCDELSNFFNPPPALLVITGHATINPDYAVVSLRRNDNVWGEVDFRSALAFAVSDTINIKPKISKIELDSQSGTLGYGAFYADLDNHLPVGVLITFYLGHASDSTLFDDPQTVILGPYQLSAGLTDSNGFVNQTVNSAISDSLGSDALALFESDSLFIGQRIRLLPTPPAGVIVCGADHIRATARAKIEFKASGEWGN
jgi:hypothetical protein